MSGGTFCIDLRFWYPSKSFGYEARSAAGLKNKENESVSALKLRRMNRALWRYGRSNNAAQQAAVMVYVHRLMADGAPGEADPNALSAASRRIYAQVVSDAERFAGPYKVRGDAAGQADRRPGGRADGRGRHLVRAQGARGRRRPQRDRGRGGAIGLHRLERHGQDDGEGDRRRATLDLEARAASLPAELPTLYAPTRGQSVRNAQRIVSAQTARPSVRVQAPVRAQPQIVTQISEQVVLAGRLDHRHRAGQRPGRPGGDDPGRALRPVRRARGDHLHRHAGLDRTLSVPGDGEYVTAPSR